MPSPPSSRSWPPGWGGIDRFIANAGLGEGAPVGTGGARPDRQVLVTNVLGTHACCEAAVALFRAQGSGHLVVISSVAGVRGMGSTRTAYATSEAAGAVLAEGIRADLLGHQATRAIRVTTIHPGFIATDINVGLLRVLPLPLVRRLAWAVRPRVRSSSPKRGAQRSSPHTRRVRGGSAPSAGSARRTAGAPTGR
jgi:NAD(P)-dependent dehydrogenase (short-subunit alcohol dehydrogenase family)